MTNTEMSITKRCKLSVCTISVQHIVTTIVLLILLSQESKSCFIRNCPPGGKRSMDLAPRGTKPCSRCGPAGLGQCVGPSICCGPFGCLMGTIDARECEKENATPVACEVDGAQCGIHGQGNCVADGVCCDSVACSVNAKCEATSSKELLVLIDRILQGKSLDV